MSIRTLGVDAPVRQRRRFHLYAASPEVPSRIIQHVCFEEGERKVEQGSFRRVKDQKTGEHIGYQLMPERLMGASHV